MKAPPRSTPKSNPESVEARLAVWWARLLPDQQRSALEDGAAEHLPEWMAQSLLRAGVPLTITPGFVTGSSAGTYRVPQQLAVFLDEKRQAGTGRKRFWRRRSSV